MSIMTSKKVGSGYIYTVPQSDIEYVGYFYGKNGNESIKSAYTRMKAIRGREPDFFFNAELFDFSTRKPVSDVVEDGKIHKLTETYGIAFPNNTKAVFSYKNNVNAKDYVGAYPVLVRNGKAETSIPSGTSGSRGRTAIGVDGDSLYIALIPDGSNDLTLSALRQAFIDCGADNAINLDGGGSTQFYAPNANCYTSRAVRGFIAVWLKKPTKSQPVASVKKADIRTVKVNSKLRIRKNPNLFSTVVGWLYNGNKVEVLETKGSWCRIDKGWVSATYLTK
jgi:hypothetical protein